MPAVRPAVPGLDWVQHSRYVNREFSWLQFNARVLAEAENKSNPLLERLKFLAIFESNLDEFYMVRVSGIHEQEASGIVEPTPDGLTPTQQLAMIADVARPLRQKASDVWSQDLRPALERNGVAIVTFQSLAAPRQREMTAFFERTVFPLCTPLMLSPAIRFPFISNRSLNLAVELREGDKTRLARVKVPPVVPRLIRLPGRAMQFVLVEDLIANHLHYLFPGVEVAACHAFRVIRDADFEILEIEAADLISAIERTLSMRRFGDPVLLECSAGLGDGPVETLRSGLKLDKEDVNRVDGLIGLDVMYALAKVDKPNLKFRPHVPFAHARVSRQPGLFAEIARRDVLVHHPYDSFRSVEEFVAAAAEDPRVIGIKQTLYRAGTESPIVESLLRAAEKGKQVAVMVELKARFDESNNLVWSRALEQAGVHVTYGFSDRKVHCKLCLVVRDEPGGIKTYAHIGTGNYNPQTARLYTDLGLFTCDPEVCQDITELFNYLTGFSRQSHYRKLLVAPLDLREQIIERIEREVEVYRTTGSGRILFKLNSLVDPEVIDALYDASEAGVEVGLVVRGICCLRPGVRKLSDRIRVVSIVGRFLEHSRVYYFENGGTPEAFIGSADMMRRNLDRRIEVLVPVKDPAQIAYLRDRVLLDSFRDNEKAWELGKNGLYRRVRRGPNDDPFELQRVLVDHPSAGIGAEGDAGFTTGC